MVNIAVMHRNFVYIRVQSKIPAVLRKEKQVFLLVFSTPRKDIPRQGKRQAQHSFAIQLRAYRRGGVMRKTKCLSLSWC